MRVVQAQSSMGACDVPLTAGCPNGGNLYGIALGAPNVLFYVGPDGVWKLPA